MCVLCGSPSVKQGDLVTTLEAGLATLKILSVVWSHSSTSILAGAEVDFSSLLLFRTIISTYFVYGSGSCSNLYLDRAPNFDPDLSIFTPFIFEYSSVSKRKNVKKRGEVRKKKGKKIKGKGKKW